MDPKVGRSKKIDKAMKTRQKMGPYSTKWVRQQEAKQYAEKTTEKKAKNEVFVNRYDDNKPL